MSNNNSDNEHREIIYSIQGETLQEQRRKLQQIIQQHQDEIEAVDIGVLRDGRSLMVLFVYRDDRQQQQQQEEDDSFMDFELYVYLAFVVPLVSYWVWGTWLYKAFY